MDPIAKVFFEYLRDVIYNPARAALDVEALPQEFRDLGEALRYTADCIAETRNLAQALSKGNLSAPLPSRGNELAAPLKALHSSLQHLTWQTQQVAKGDYQQRVAFMGNFAVAFNAMVEQLEERRKIEEDAKSKLQRYVNLLLSNCPDIILLFDSNGQVVSTSESYLRHCNVDNPDSIRNQSFQELFVPVANAEFLQRMEERLRAAMADKLSSEIEHAIAFGRDDNVRHYRIQVTPILDDFGIAVGTMLFFTDLTESIHARELAEESARAKSAFLARMSHEMRTPMNAIIGMTTLAKASDATERTAYCLDKISVASQHLLGVINDILDMSSFEADTFALSFNVFNVAKMVRHVVGTLHFRLEERKQTLSLDIDGAMPATIVSDEQRLAQVIANLLSNAIKFTPEQGAISLIARKIAEEDGICTLRFVVQDTGIGISEEQRARLFVSFEQADGGFSRKFSGTGLGLAIAKRIVDMMDGRIWLDSELGKGSVFTCEIKAKTGPREEVPPVLPDASAAFADARGQTREEAQDGAPLFAGKRILVAEDIDINREIVASLLEDTGAELVFAADGAEAVAVFSAAPGIYHAILMDIHMPEVDGYEATRRIRASGLQGADTIPIIAMTANTFREDIDQCLAAGMNSHLAKPIDLTLLVAELSKHLLSG